jgi:diguanylate cyclase (GGDEF)-like protein/PAS domain S-box-containing protein
MIGTRLPKHKSDQIEAPKRQLDKLTSANERLQVTIAEHLVSEDKWSNERALFRAMIDQVPDYLFVKDKDSRFIIANRAVAADLGLTPEDLIGKTDFELHPTELAGKFYAQEQKVVATGEAILDIEEFVLEVSGRKKWLSTSKVALRNGAGEVIGIVGVSRDITERKCVEDKMHFMAHHDALTGLPNRTLLMDRLEQALLHSRRNDRRVTLIFIDFDNFKQVNDSLGHDAGDELLKVMAARFVKCVRSSDTVVRLGGDEFVVLLHNQPDHPQLVSVVLNKLRDAISAPVLIKGKLLRETCSIGLATFPEDGMDADTLLMNADIAMYYAKESGRDNFQYYTSEMNLAAHQKRELLEGMRMALERNEFSLVYQPQVDMKTGMIFAVEALIRWNHPELGVVAPSTFIPIAEDSGLIVQIGDWVLREACRQNKAWQSAGMPPITISVNVSARQFMEKNLIKRVLDALQESGLEAKFLELELTESVLMRDVALAVAILNKLRTVGVQFAIDDFGTGYSSLSALKSFPVARLKIDQSFIRNLPYDANDRSIATAVISLGKQLNMKVIAEGVESGEQLHFLANQNCDEVQGFLISKPVSPEAVTTMLDKQHTGSRPFPDR